MKKLLIGAFVLSGALFISSCGDNSGSDTSTTTTTTDSADTKEVAKEQNENKFDTTNMKEDAEWAVKVADAGMLEVQLAKLALTNAASSKVKDFAKMMEDDHTKANEELIQAAKQKNISLPAAMSDKCQKKYDELASKKGADFDKAYMSAMVDGHKDVVDEFKKEADKGKDADLKTWATNKLPTIEHHLEMAKTTKDAIK